MLSGSRSIWNTGSVKLVLGSVTCRHADSEVYQAQHKLTRANDRVKGINERASSRALGPTVCQAKSMAGTALAVSCPPTQSVGSSRHVCTPSAADAIAAAKAAVLPPTITTSQAISGPAAKAKPRPATPNNARASKERIRACSPRTNPMKRRISTRSTEARRRNEKNSRDAATHTRT